VCWCFKDGLGYSELLDDRADVLKGLLSDLLEFLVGSRQDILHSVELTEGLNLVHSWRECEGENRPAFLEFVEPKAEQFKVVPSALVPQKLGCL